MGWGVFLSVCFEDLAFKFVALNKTYFNQLAVCEIPVQSFNKYICLYTRNAVGLCSGLEKSGA